MTLAYGVLRGGGVCARVDGRVLDLSALDESLTGPSLNALMARGPGFWAELAGRVGEGRELESPELTLPFSVADYVDFYSSLHHATNLGRMFRPGSEPLLPNWRHLPVGYHGRAGTVVASGTPVRRPSGQRPGPEFGPSRRLDIELEAGFVIGTPSELGEPVAVRGGARSRVRHGARERLVGTRHPGLGVPAARPIPGQVVRHLDLPLGGAAERAGDRRVASPPQEPEPLPYLREQPGPSTSTSRWS